MSETPTPRTDACEALCPCGAKYVDSDVARNFERALTAERAARERAEAERDALRADAERLRAVAANGWVLDRDIEGDWQVRALRRYGESVLLAEAATLAEAIDAARKEKTNG